MVEENIKMENENKEINNEIDKGINIIGIRQDNKDFEKLKNLLIEKGLINKTEI